VTLLVDMPVVTGVGEGHHLVRKILQISTINDDS